MKRRFTYGLGLVPAFALLLAVRLAHADSGDTDVAQASQPRSVPAFHGLDLAGVLGADVTLGKQASVTITGDADLIDKVTTTVKDGILVIDTRELHHVHRHNMRLHAIVTAPDLSSLAVSGTGSIAITGVANDRLAMDVSGTGAIKASGSTGALNVQLSGTGEVSGKDLAAKDVVVDIHGTGSARLNATRSVDARISGTGSLSVHGHPAQIKKSVTGLGSVHIE
ncbi:MAG TPA: head GIN domain-containing protein [Kofleriaceae bacterium]|jgi:hypothetical protein|nr:head GIN domain-containing protein [Kofleriaceae bacterium]